MLTKPHVFAVLLAVAACTWAGAAPVLDGSHITQQTLPNGLRILVKESPHWDLVSLAFVVKASPMYEAENQHGLSDLVRYMMFETAPEGAAAVDNAFDDLGASFSSHTSPDATEIRLTVSTHALPELFPKLVKAVFEPKFDEAVWAKELPELRRRLMDSQNTATGRLWQLLWGLAFRSHPYGRPVSGVPDTMAAFDAGSLAKFHQAFYVPNNMSLVVVGDVKAADIVELARAQLGKYPSHPVTEIVVPPEPPQTDTRTRLEKAATRGTIVAYGWRAAGMDHKRDVCSLDLIYALLGEGTDSRLGKALAENPKIQAVPQVEFITKRDPGLFIIWCVAKPENEFDVRNAVEGELEKLRAVKLTEEELAAAKDVNRAGYAFDNQTYAGQVGSMGFYQAIDTYQFAVDYLSEVEKVTVDDIQRVARDYLGASNYSLVIIRPKTTGGATWEANSNP